MQILPFHRVLVTIASHFLNFPPQSPICYSILLNAKWVSEYEGLGVSESVCPCSFQIRAAKTKFPNPRAWKFQNPMLKFPNPGGANPKAWKFPNPTLKFLNPGGRQVSESEGLEVSESDVAVSGSGGRQVSESVSFEVSESGGQQVSKSEGLEVSESEAWKFPNPTLQFPNPGGSELIRWASKFPNPGGSQFPNPRAWKFPNPPLKFPNPGGSEFPNPRAWKFPNPTLKFPNPGGGEFPTPRAWGFPNPTLKFPNPTLAHIFVWGSCFWFCIPPAPPPPAPPPPAPPPPTPPRPLLFDNHHLSHTSLSHTIFHTHLCQPPSFTQYFVNRHLSHTFLSTTISHTHLCHTPSFTHYLSHIFVNHHLSHTSLSHTIFHIHLCQPPSFTHYLSHTSLSHTIFSTILCQPPSFTHHLSHTIFHTQLCQPPSLTHTHIFVTHHLSHTSLSTTISHVAGVAQAWHLLTSIFVSRGRRGIWWHPPPFHVAGLALGDICRRQAWHLVTWHAWRLVTSAFVSRGQPPSLTWQAALADIYLRFAWQAWHFVTSTFVCVACVALRALGWLWCRAWAGFGRRWRHGTLRGRRGTWWHLPSFHVAGVALGDIHLRFAWQAWHLVTSTFVLRGRRGT